jgi:acyl carrier protein
MTIEKLKTIISSQLGVPVDQISNDDHIVADLNADSLDLVELVMEIERAFKVQIEQDEYENAMTVDKIAILVDKKLQ